MTRDMKEVYKNSNNKMFDCIKNGLKDNNEALESLNEILETYETIRSFMTDLDEAIEDEDFTHIQSQMEYVKLLTVL